MNSIGPTDSYSQLMQVINNARIRNSGLGGAVLRTAPAAATQPIQQPAPAIVRSAGADALSAPRTTGKVLGTYFDAYA